MSAPIPYRIHTTRLVIRCWEPRDAPWLKEAIDASLDHLRPWMPWAAHEPQSLEAKVNLIRRFRGQFDLDQDYIYGIFDRDETRVLGGTGLHTRTGEHAREIGYWIRSDAINRGYATEVTAALTQVAFALLGMLRVEIHCDPENARSAAVPRKLGYTHEATRRKTYPGVNDTWRDTMIWTLLAEEYPGSPAAGVETEVFDAGGNQIL